MDMDRVGASGNDWIDAGALRALDLGPPLLESGKILLEGKILGEKKGSPPCEKMFDLYNRGGFHLPERRPLKGGRY